MCSRAAASAGVNAYSTYDGVQASSKVWALPVLRKRRAVFARPGGKGEQAATVGASTAYWVPVLGNNAVAKLLLILVWLAQGERFVQPERECGCAAKRSNLAQLFVFGLAVAYGKGE